MTDPIRILAFAAHPDDLEFGAGGSMAKWAAEGAAIRYIILTDGGSGSDDPATKMAALINLRETEQWAACTVLGIDDLHFWRIPDGGLIPTLGLRWEIVRAMRLFKPDRVLCPDPTAYFTWDNTRVNHPDHRAVGQAVIEAVYPAVQSALTYPDLLAEGVMPHVVKELWMFFTSEATHVEDISDYYATKLDALRCHASQIKDFAALTERMETRHREAGEPHSFAYGEAFRVINMTG
jgi:LmbE family N-acetylglucosaminyl deacetylase